MVSQATTNDATSTEYHDAISPMVAVIFSMRDNADMMAFGTSCPSVHESCNHSVLTVELPMTCKPTIPKRRGSAKPQVNPYVYRISTCCVDRAIVNAAQLAAKSLGWGVSPFKGELEPTVGR